MKVWMSPGIKESNHYAARLAAGIVGIILLAAVLLGGGVFLMFHFEELKLVISVALCLGVTALIIWLAFRVGRKSMQDVTFFVQDEQGRMFVIDARDYVREKRGILGLIHMAADTQKQIEKIKDYVNKMYDLSMVAPQILYVENLKENEDAYVLLCRVRFPGNVEGRRTYFLVKGYEQEQELLWALERQRYRENAWEVKEDKKPFWIFGNSLLLAAAVMVCVLSHPAVGVLALNVYFPCLGIAFLLLTVLIYLIVKRHRGE